MTIYSSGIEKLMAVYSVELLDQEQYRLIVSSAKANARALKGAKKHRFLDRAQRSAPLHQVIVIVIFADRVEEQLRTELSGSSAGICSAVGFPMPPPRRRCLPS